MLAKVVYLVACIVLCFNNSARCQVSDEWVATIPQGASNQRVLKLSLDNLGHPYVLIEEIANGDGSDILLVKYDATGDLLWQTRYNGPGNAGDSPVAMQVDETGNVYVTAESEGVESDLSDPCYVSAVDYVTLKYDSNGNQVWATRFNGPANGGDAPAGVLVDPVGNVYVTGTSYAYSTCTASPGSSLDLAVYNDFVTIKYDANGNRLWERRFIASQVRDSRGISLAPGNDDSFHVLGRIGSEIVSIKYDSEGNELWVKNIQGDYPAYIVTDAFGNSYIAASAYGDKPVVKYDTYGQLVWQNRIQNWSGIVGIELDRERNVYVGGTAQGASLDYVVSKWDANGRHLWMTTYLKSGPPYSNEQATTITIDAAGDIYLTGFSYVNPLVPQDITTVKFTSDGNIAWEWNGLPDASNNSYAIVVDSLQNVYIGGSITGVSFEYALFKLSQNSGTPGDGSSPASSGGGGGGGCFVTSASQ
jgi:hypothetical protein